MKSSTALLLIDIQNDYFPEGNYPLPHIAQCAENAAKLLQHFRKQANTVIHVWHVEKDPHSQFFIPGTNGVAIASVVQPKRSEILIEKNYPNSFRGTTLSTDIASLGITHLVICGAMSNMCIDSTVRAAFDLGFDCTVIADACAASALSFGQTTIPAENVHASFMGALAQGYARVISTAEYLASKE